jgi:hypothetical protein
MAEVISQVLFTFLQPLFIPLFVKNPLFSPHLDVGSFFLVDFDFLVVLCNYMLAVAKGISLK